MDRFRQFTGTGWNPPGKRKNRGWNHRIQRRKLKEELERYLRPGDKNKVEI
jgi:hypothetical protein